ncbi:MAG: 50S ribosomal protein L9 [Verrucomicrobia bacterium]|nr:50S ribosomal protein L9 [Verrucomicrobiota bacterium]
MAKVEVILTQNVVNLGAESDRVKVATGYARNFLFPQRLAIPLTAANKRRLEVLRQRRAEREAHELNTMTDLARALSKLTLLISVKTGDEEKMFGSVTAGTIADELKHQFEVALDKRKIHLEKPIRTLGEHEVELRLHPEVATTLKLRVESTTPQPAPVEAPPGGPKTASAATRADAKAGGEPRAERTRRERASHHPKTEAKPRSTRSGTPADASAKM